MVPFSPLLPRALGPGLAAFSAQEIFWQRPEPKPPRCQGLSERQCAPRARSSTFDRREALAFPVLISLTERFERGRDAVWRRRGGLLFPRAPGLRSPPGTPCRAHASADSATAPQGFGANAEQSYRTVLHRHAPVGPSPGGVSGSPRRALAGVPPRPLSQRLHIDATLLKATCSVMSEIRERNIKTGPQQSLGK